MNMICIGQDSIKIAHTDEYLSTLSTRTEKLGTQLDKQSQKAINTFQKEEDKIIKKLSHADSSKAKELLASAKTQYQYLAEKLAHPENSNHYIPYLDTLKNSIQFLAQSKALLSKTKELDATLDKIKGLETSFTKAEDIAQFIRDRKQYLQQQLSANGLTKELKKLSKQAYYYSARINEYKEALTHSKKLERKAIEALSKTKAFRDFMNKHGELASLFRLPGNDDMSSASIQGLQTRANITDLIQARFGTGTGVQSMVQQNVQSAQDQLSSLKDRMSSLGTSTGDEAMPDFKPNNQKTKTFLNRLEYGSNIQTQRSSRAFPVTSDLGLSIGYKLNDKSIVGIGASYKLGWGTGWNNIHITHQGIGLRSFINYKLKGSLFISGGYEQNYRAEIRKIEQLKQYSAWQASGLAGLSKQYSVSKKVKGNVQLLWDFLSYYQLPKTQPLIFRIGYNLK